MNREALSTSNPWTPYETSSQLFSEKTWLQGAFLSNLAYGVELTLFLTCFKLLLTQRKRSHDKIRVNLLIFITLVFVLDTIFMGCNAKSIQLAFIQDRNFPGGPSAWLDTSILVPVNTVSIEVAVISIWLTDLLLVWRCLVIFTGFSRVALWSAMFLPCLLFVNSICFGTIFLVKTYRSSPFSSDAVNYTLAYFSTTLALNVIVTIFIVARLLACRWRFGSVLGAQHVSHYSNLAAILVESASLYSLFLISFLVSLALNYPLAQVLLQAVGQVQSISSLLIIFRVATGRGWTRDTNSQIMAYSDSNAVHVGRLQAPTNRTGDHVAVVLDDVLNRVGDWNFAV